ncbi:T9SS type A sorting domain-containing protein [Flavobacterium sp. 17A]|uniref:T9SS type A sorting domain-containing protein n=1 Tax=Flavobacterium potami TaxID=2872310 RepID=A0A9X1HA95_9FLAO|nr:T9SS type A sorting domain-containing protein [Flavobacterium potami]MBZ4035366.1 T9SS type A sorting domain-containing protein [Flavobacterium potami]
MKKKYFLLLLFLFVILSVESQTKLQFSINQAPVLKVDAGSSKTILPGTSTVLGGSPSASGGNGNYSYLWAPSEGLSQTNVANPVANPLKTTQYTLTVNDGKKCSTNVSVTITVSSNLGTEEMQDESGLVLYPNPSTGSFSIKSEKSLSSGPILIEIYNVLGSLVFSETILDGNKLNKTITLPNKSSGVYYVKLTGNGLNISKPVIIL